MFEKENFELNKHCLPLQVFRYQEKTCRHRDDVMRCTERVGHHKTFVACRYHGEYPAKINKSCNTVTTTSKFMIVSNKTY